VLEGCLAAKCVGGGGVWLKTPLPYFTFKYFVKKISQGDVIKVKGFLF